MAIFVYSGDIWERLEGYLEKHLARGENIQTTHPQMLGEVEKSGFHTDFVT